MKVRHYGRSIGEIEKRHKVLNGHTKFGKLQVKEEPMKIVGAGVKQSKITVFKECLDCIKETKEANKQLSKITA